MAPLQLGQMSSFDEEDEPQDKQGCLKKVLRTMLSHVGLLIIVVLYSLGGAYLFIQLELPAEELRRENKRRVSMDIKDAMEYIIHYMYFVSGFEMSKEEMSAVAEKNLITFHDFVVAKASDSAVSYDGNVNTWDYSWTFSKSLLFTVTSISSIGYGHIAPKTFGGKIATIVYNVVGLPLYLVFLANIGDFMASTFVYIYSRLCCRWCRVRRKKSTLKEEEKLESRFLLKENIGAEEYMPTDEVDVPIVVNLCLISFYLVLGGIIFSSAMTAAPLSR